MVFSEAVALMGDALGIIFDEIVCEAEYAKTTKELDLGSWTLAKDTVAGVTIHWLGKIDGKTIVEMRVRDGARVTLSSPTGRSAWAGRSRSTVDPRSRPRSTSCHRHNF